MRQAKNSLARTALCVVAALAPAMTPAVAHAGLTIVSCDAPAGWRVDYFKTRGDVEPKLQTGEDRFKRPKALFVLDSDDPGTLLELLLARGSQAASKPAISKEFLANVEPRNLRRHQVVLKTDGQVSAVDVAQQAVYTISIYLRLGVAILTRASSESGATESGVGAVYYAECGMETQK